MDFELQFGKRGGPGRRNPGDGARRILVLGDFAGRAARGEVPAREPLASRPLVRAPQEGAGVDAALEALAPALALPPSIAGATPTLELHALEDFHPDALFRRLAVFRDPPRAAVAPAAAPAAAGKNDADDIERLLGKRPAAAAVSATSAVDDLIRPIIAGHVASAPPDAPLDAVALGRIMRALLHQPAFQALEARWRALELLVSRADEAVEIIVLDVTRAELLADLLPGGADAASDPTLDGSALARRVLSPPGGRPFAALIGDFAFGPGAEDAALLGRLGALAAAAGAPFVAGAAPALLGRPSLAGADDAAGWEALAPDDARRWQALRRGPAAPWVGLALPRFLARAPYGAKTAAIDSFAFEEIEGRPAPETLCWASGAFLCALALARGEEAGDAEDIDDLPYFTFRGADGDVEMYPSTEVFWSQRAAEAALGRGLMPLLSARDRNVARLVRLQSIADPPRALAGATEDAG
ncbi:MAG TPA: type VI secretion system contractile sheath large subunit [Polyangia bacterium]|nr:type VI secretion system contractile sheath large subunit [Polyangia bacterium]